jgi:hypothetical protein
MITVIVKLVNIDSVILILMQIGANLVSLLLNHLIVNYRN